MLYDRVATCKLTMSMEYRKIELILMLFIKYKYVQPYSFTCNHNHYAPYMYFSKDVLNIAGNGWDVTSRAPLPILLFTLILTTLSKTCLLGDCMDRYILYHINVMKSFIFVPLFHKHTYNGD